MAQQYLTKRKGSPYWHLRYLIPTSLQALIGKKEILVSLKTEDRGLAEKFKAVKLAEFYAKWDPAVQPAAAEALSGKLPIIRPDNAAMIQEAALAGYEMHSKNLAVKRHQMADATQEDFVKYKTKRGR